MAIPTFYLIFTIIMIVFIDVVMRIMYILLKLFKYHYGIFSTVMLLLMMCMTSCVRNTIEYVPPEGVAGLNVPLNFNWSNLKEVEVNVIPFDEYNGQYKYVIEIFNGNPVIDSTATLLSAGVANINMSYRTKLSVPSATETLYIRQTDPRRLETVQTLPLTSGSLECNFNISNAAKYTERRSMIAALKTATSVKANETPSDAILLKSGSSNVILEQNKSYVIPAGNTYTGKISFSAGSQLYIEGNLNETASNAFQMADNTRLVIQRNGVLDVRNATQSFWSGEIINYGTTSFGTIDISGSVTISNLYGNLDVFTKLITRNNTNKIVNNSVMTIKSLQLTNGSIENTYYLSITNDLTANGATVKNDRLLSCGNISSTNSTYHINCNTQILADFIDNNGSVINIASGTKFKSYGFSGSGTKVYFQSSAIFEATDVTFGSNSSIFQCLGNTYAIARMVHVKPGNGSYQCIFYKGKLEIEVTSHFKGLNQWNAFYIAEPSVRWSKSGASTTIIPSTDCNAEGNIVVPPLPQPTQPTYPIEGATTNYTLLMEDNWPSIGDYDMNDLVLGLSISYLKDANNMVTGMKLNTELRAVGAKKRIGIALQLDEVLPENVKSITYSNSGFVNDYIFPKLSNGCETGQNKAVVALFDDAHTALDPTLAIPFTKLLNTYNDQPKIASALNNLNISFTQPLEPSLIDITRLNFFIVTDGSKNSTRRVEVHLAGFKPTDKNDWTKLGRGYDNSLNGTYYTTPGNMIWGLLIPENIKYSSEMKDITITYPAFVTWCTSGGVNASNWYLQPTSVTGYLYEK